MITVSHLHHHHHHHHHHQGLSPFFSITISTMASLLALPCSYGPAAAASERRRPARLLSMATATEQQKPRRDFEKNSSKTPSPMPLHGRKQPRKSSSSSKLFRTWKEGRRKAYSGPASPPRGASSSRLRREDEAKQEEEEEDTGMKGRNGDGEEEGDGKLSSFWLEEEEEEEKEEEKEEDVDSLGRHGRGSSRPSWTSSIDAKIGSNKQGMLSRTPSFEAKIGSDEKERFRFPRVADDSREQGSVETRSGGRKPESLGGGSKTTTRKAGKFSNMKLDCVHFSECPGCVLESALDKPPVLNDAMIFFRNHAIHNFSLVTKNMWEWRCRAKLAVRGSAQDPQIGIYQEGSHNVVDIPHCRVHHPRINMAVEYLKEGIMKLGVQPYDEDTGSGDLRYVQMTITTHNTSIAKESRYINGRVQVSLVWNARSEQSSNGELLKSLSEFLWQRAGPKSATPILHSVWANFQTSRTNVIFGGRWRHFLGEQDCWERVGGVDLCLTPSSFAQANLQAFNALLQSLQKYVPRGSSVVELYAGAGAISLSLAATRACRSVKCVEINKESEVPFKLSLARLPKSNESNISWHCADASQSPITWLSGAEIVIMDPPRKGLDATVIQALRTASRRGEGKTKMPSREKVERIEKRPWIDRAKQSIVQKESYTEEEDDGSIWPEKLIYVSCGWNSFKLDCEDLVEGEAWHLEAAEAFNFFPGTDSIEVLAVFKRGKRIKPKKK